MVDDVKSLEREHRLDEVLAAYLEALEAGQKPDRAALLRDHPDLAEDLQAFFEDQAQFDSLVAPLKADAVSSSRAWLRDPDLTRPFVPQPEPLPPRGRQFGDYLLLQEIARGGMGIVYQAQQLRANRLVALKMILAGGAASAEELQRFRLEAEAAAHLDHPNIVPLYEIGEHDGQPFFSMKLIEGTNLSREMAHFPGHPREAAQLMVTVARAVDHAHQHGILHRDLKPANILLARRTSSLAGPPEEETQTACPAVGAEDRQDCLAWEPHITDFGLAKRLEAAASRPGDSRLTQSGAAVGTPAYMAPEQAAGKKGLTIAADIYSLGAILYEMLTGRPPFRADSPLNTMMEVVYREPTRPRLLNPRLHRDLETICLKCLAKEPARRYTSAALLAEDLERYLTGKPTLARPVGNPERLARWCWRNPALALTSSLVAASLVAVAVVSCLLYLAERRHEAGLMREQEQTRLAKERAEWLAIAAEQHAAEAQRQATEAEQQRRQAEDSFRLAHQAISDCSRIAEELSNVPGLQPQRRELDETVLKYSKNFLAQRKYHPSIGPEVAGAYFRVARLTSAIGSKQEALTSYGEALKLYRELVREHPQEMGLRSELSNTLNNMGILQEAIGHAAEARTFTEEALALCQQLVQEHPDHPDSLRNLANTVHHLAHLEQAAGHHEEALVRYEEARTLWEQLVCAYPQASHYQGDLALCINNTGVLYSQLGRPLQALHAYEEARAIREKLVEEAPTDSGSQIALAASYHDLGVAHGQLGHQAESLHYAQLALERRQKVVDENPKVTQFRSDLAGSLTDVGYAHLDNKEMQAALDCFQRALHIQHDLVQLDPSVSAFQSDLARSHFNCGLVLNAHRQREDAVRAYQTARQIQEKLVRNNPDRFEYRSQLAATLNNLGLLMGQLGHHGEGRDILHQAIEHQQTARARAPQLPAYRHSLANHWGALAEVERSAGRPSAAVAALLERRRLCADNAQELYRVAVDLEMTAEQVGKGKKELAADEKAERNRCMDLALETLRQALAAGYPDRERLRKDTVWTALREREEFVKLLDGQ